MDVSGLPLDRFTLAAVVNNLDRSVPSEAASAIEFRMDHADDPISQLKAYDGQLPIIATNRAKWEGGAAADAGRLDALRVAATQPMVAAIDIELASVDEAEASTLRDVARDHGTTIIVSWHDFEQTPSRSSLTERLQRACDWGDIGKLAVTAQSPEDVLDVLTVTQQLTQSDCPVATMCMGTIGRHSRIIAPVYGSRIGYAPVESADASAPGQFPLEEMAALIDALS